MSRLSPEELSSLAKDIEYTNKIEDCLRRTLKPLGTYNIPDLLDKRRFEYLIPNGAFESYPVFDKCYIWQISMLNGRNTYKEGGKILKPDNELAREKNTAPRGILISAGLKAMDALYSTGVEIGHIVRFKKFSPFIMPVGEIEGKELAVMVIRDGDVEASEDLANSLNSRASNVRNVSEKGYDFRVTGDISTGKKVDEYYDPSI
jgi:hypothetical protein